jgi:hypothetical protein
MPSQEDLDFMQELEAVVAILGSPPPPDESDSPAAQLASRFDGPDERAREAAKLYSVPILLERLRLFKVGTASSPDTAVNLLFHLTMFVFLGGSRGRVSLGTLKGKTCILRIAQLARGSLNDETSIPPKTIDWLLREVTLLGKSREVLQRFKAFSLGRIIVNNVLSYWVAFLSEEKDIWVLRANTVAESELNKRSQDSQKELSTPENGSISSGYEKMEDLYDGVAINVGSLEELKVAEERGQDFMTSGNNRSAKGVCGWSSVLIPAPPKN